MTRAYVALIAVICMITLLYAYLMPAPSLSTTRDGVPFFTPPVIHPETGDALELGELIRHYKGD